MWFPAVSMVLWSATAAARTTDGEGEAATASKTAAETQTSAASGGDEAESETATATVPTPSLTPVPRPEVAEPVPPARARKPSPAHVQAPACGGYRDEQGQALHPLLPHQPVVIVVSGGISAGVYLAGQLYVLTEHLKIAEAARKDLLARQRAWEDQPTETNRPTRAECAALTALGSRQDVVITGASAGTVSALTTLVTLMDPERTPDPEDSAFFAAWMQLGIDQSHHSLDFVPRPFPPRGTEPPDWLLSLGTTDAIAKEFGRAIEEYPALDKYGWTGSLRIGFTTTRLNPEPVDGGLYMQAKEVFALEAPPASNRGAGVQWLTYWCDETAETTPGVEPHRNRCERQHRQVARTPLGSPAVGNDTAAGTAGLVSLVKASGAFPGAFAPRELSCAAFSEWSFWGSQCPDTMAEGPAPSIRFIDGGTFDNNPGQLGQILACTAWDEQENHGLACQPTLLYPDPDLHEPLVPALAPPVSQANPAASAVGSASTFLKSFVPTIQTLSLADHHRDTNPGETVAMPQRTNPTSGRFGAFMGFFDRTLRAWDFYAGMYDAMVSIQDNLMPTVYTGYPTHLPGGPPTAGEPSPPPFWSLLPDRRDDFASGSYYRKVRDAFEAFHPTLDAGEGVSFAERWAVALERGTADRSGASSNVRDLVRREFGTPEENDSATENAALGIYPYVLWTAKSRSDGDQEPPPPPPPPAAGPPPPPRVPVPAPAPPTTRLEAFAATEALLKRGNDPAYRYVAPRGRRGLVPPELTIARNLEVLTILALEEQLRLEDRPTVDCPDQHPEDHPLNGSCNLRVAGHDDLWFLTELSKPQSWCIDNPYVSLRACARGRATTYPEVQGAQPTTLAHAWFTPFDLYDQIGDLDPWADLLGRRVYYAATSFTDDEAKRQANGMLRTVTRMGTRLALGPVVGPDSYLTAEMGNLGFGVRSHKFRSRPRGYWLDADLHPRRPWKSTDQRQRGVLGVSVRGQPGLGQEPSYLRAGGHGGLAFRVLRSSFRGTPARDKMVLSDRPLTFIAGVSADVVWGQPAFRNSTRTGTGFELVASPEFTVRVIDLIGVRLGADVLTHELGTPDPTHLSFHWSTLTGAIEVRLPGLSKKAPPGMRPKQRQEWRQAIRAQE